MGFSLALSFSLSLLTSYSSSTIKSSLPFFRRRWNYRARALISACVASFVVNFHYTSAALERTHSLKLIPFARAFAIERRKIRRDRPFHSSRRRWKSERLTVLSHPSYEYLRSFYYHRSRVMNYEFIDSFFLGKIYYIVGWKNILDNHVAMFCVLSQIFQCWESPDSKFFLYLIILDRDSEANMTKCWCHLR